MVNAVLDKLIKTINRLTAAELAIEHEQKASAITVEQSVESSEKHIEDT